MPTIKVVGILLNIHIYIKVIIDFILTLKDYFRIVSVMRYILTLKEDGIMETLIIDGTNLTIENMFSVLDGGHYKVKIKNVKHQNNDEIIDASYGQDIFQEYAQCYGDLLPSEIGKLSLYLLLNYSIKYSNALSKEFIHRIIAFIDYGISPCIHSSNKTEKAAMSELALILSGEENLSCYYNGEFNSVGKIFHSLGLNKIIFTEEEVSVLFNLCCISTSISVYALKQAERLAKTADICVAMNLEAIRGETGAFDRRLHELARPYINQIISAENIRRILEDSEFTTEEARIAFGGDNGPRCQDAICIRAVPQTHGGVRDTISWLRENLEREINAISYKINPLIGYSLDLMLIGLIDLGNISERRSFRLTDSNLTYGLPMNLVGENPGFNHGFPVVQASATAVLGELKLLAMPCSSNSRIDPISREYICTTYSSALKMIEAISLLNKILAIEMYMTAQGMDLAKDKLVDFKFGKGTSVALNEFRKHIKTVRANRFAAPDMVKANRLISEGVILNVVEKNIGDLS